LSEVCQASQASKYIVNATFSRQNIM